MDINQSRLSWLSEYGLSQNAIADSLGVSQSTVSRWSTGVTTPSVNNQRLLRNLYQRSVYKASRDSGMTPEEARDSSWRSAKTNVLVLPSLSGAITNVIDNRAKEEINRLIKSGIDYDPKSVWESAKQKVLKGISRSQATIDDIKERYGKASTL